MAFLCVALLLSVADGQLHNLHSPQFDNIRTQNHHQDGSSVKEASSLPLDVLLFMQSSSGNAQVENPSEQRETRVEGTTAGKSPDLPPGLSKLFTSMVLEASNSNKNAYSNPDLSLKDEDTVLRNNKNSQSESSQEESEDSLIPATKESVKLDEKTRQTLSNASHSSKYDIHRKIRRNRDRNHHRKVRQRHAGLPKIEENTVLSTPPPTHVREGSVSKTKHNLQRDAVADQHFRFLLGNSVLKGDRLDGVPRGTEKGPNASLIKSEKTIEVQTFTPDMATKDKTSKVGKSLRIRKKRGTALPGQFSPLTGYAMGRDAMPGDTFFYRRPEGHTGALGRSHEPQNSRQHDTHSGSQPDPLVHSLEIENKEEEYQKPTPETPPAEVLAELNAEEEKVASLSERQVEPEQDQVRTKGDLIDTLPGTVGENSTVNETLARQMFRSPMLVDYGSRVKPQDVLQPTEPDPEETAVEEGKEEVDPAWTEGKAIEEVGTAKRLYIYMCIDSNLCCRTSQM